MKRVTRRIGVFGGTGSMMSALGGKESVPAAPTSKKPSSAPDDAEELARTEAPKKRSWLGRLLGKDEK
jgi:hypothetical protein